MKELIRPELILEGKLAQAYLISSDSKTASHKAAADLIRQVFCQSGTGCGTCIACRRFDAGNHPDILVIRNDLESIRKEDIQELTYFLSVKPVMNGYRCIYIEDAEKMTPAVQNKLLKSFEDPPAHTVFVLSAVHTGLLLPTVVSRCSVIRIQNELASSSDAPEFRAALMQAGGSRSEAQELINSASYQEMRKTVTGIAGRLVRGRISAVSMAKDIIGTGDVKTALFMLAGLLTDCAAYRMGTKGLRYAPDAEDIIKQASLSPSVLSLMADTVTQSMSLESTYRTVPDRLITESMFIDLYRIIKG